MCLLSVPMEMHHQQNVHLVFPKSSMSVLMLHPVSFNVSYQSVISLKRHSANTNCLTMNTHLLVGVPNLSDRPWSHLRSSQTFYQEKHVFCKQELIKKFSLVAAF